MTLLVGDSGESPQARDMFGYFAGRQAELGDRLLGDLDRLMGMRGMQALCLECPAGRTAARPSGPWSSEAPGLASMVARLLLD
jgi:protease-4